MCSLVLRKNLDAYSIGFWFTFEKDVLYTEEIRTNVLINLASFIQRERKIYEYMHVTYFGVNAENVQIYTFIKNEIFLKIKFIDTFRFILASMKRLFINI